MEIIDVIMVLVTGIASGVFYAFGGFLKSFRKEEFTKTKFVFTMLLGIATGGIMGGAEIMGYNINCLQIETWLGSMGFVMLLDYLAKFIIREHEHRTKAVPRGNKEDVK